MPTNLEDYAPKRFLTMPLPAEVRDDLIRKADSTSDDVRHRLELDAASAASGSPSYHAYYPAMRNVLLTGVPGVGKTTVGKNFASYMVERAKSEGWPTLPPDAFVKGARVHDQWTSPELPRWNDEYFRWIYYVCTRRTTLFELQRMIYFVVAGGIIVWDEIQNLQPEVTRDLLGVLNNGVMRSPIREDGLLGGIDPANPEDPDGPRAELEEIKKSSFMIVGITTDESRMAPAFYDRFKPIGLRLYDPEEMVPVVRAIVEATDMVLADGAIGVLVSRSRRHPRTATQGVRDLEEVWMSNHRQPEVIDADFAVSALNRAGFGPGGLSRRDAMVLEVLDAAEHPVGSQHLAEMCSLGTKENLDRGQQWMVVDGHVEITPRGRVITTRGRQLLESYRVQIPC